MRRRLSRLAAASALLLAPALVLALTGCSAQSSTAVGVPAPAHTSTSASARPATIDNCGTPLAVGTHPRRIVTIKSSATELLLALGLRRRIIGTAFLDGPIPQNLVDGAAPPSISPFLPGQEAVLALKPDFIYGGWESNFAADGVGERASLAKLGIGTYVSPSACKERSEMPDPLTFGVVFREITEAGRVFGAEQKARALVAAQKAQLHALKPAAKRVSALWYSSGSTTPYVGAGIGAPEMIMRAAGLTNIFANVHDTWSSVGWESVAAANPHVIVLVDASWSTAAKKMAQLESNPVTSSLDAVVHHRYIVLPFASTEAGVRNVAAAASVIAQLRTLEQPKKLSG